MQSHVEFVKTVICSEEMAVQYLREHNLLDDPEEAVMNWMNERDNWTVAAVPPKQILLQSNEETLTEFVNWFP
jgi:hypothetical protein